MPRDFENDPDALHSATLATSFRTGAALRLDGGAR